MRNGPYFATLDPASVADERTGKTLERAGFDPFNDQETYSRKNHKKKRAVPDLEGAEREYGMSTLHLRWSHKEDTIQEANTRLPQL